MYNFFYGKQSRSRISFFPNKLPLRNQHPSKIDLDELKEIATDNRVSTLALETQSATLSADEVQELARTTVQNCEPRAFLTLANTYPDVVTAEFTENTIHNIRPNNTFIAQLADEKDNQTTCQALQGLSLFDSRDTRGIKDFLSNNSYRVSKPYIIHEGEYHETSTYSLRT